MLARPSSDLLKLIVADFGEVRLSRCTNPFHNGGMKYVSEKGA